MKIRWTERSVRLRITPEELGSLQRGGEIDADFTLIGGSWSVRVAPSETTSLSMNGGALRFSLAREDVKKLGEPEREGVYFSDGRIRYFLEKDFPCAHPRAGEAEEEATSTFAPPEGFEERKNS